MDPGMPFGIRVVTSKLVGLAGFGAVMFGLREQGVWVAAGDAF